MRVRKIYTALDCKGRCAFVNEEESTCALKLAYKDKKVSFGIPQSCFLYPLFKIEYGGKTYLTVINSFEDYCASALDKGEKEDIYLTQFCKEAIIDAFGEYFYSLIENEQQKYTSLAPTFDR